MKLSTSLQHHLWSSPKSSFYVRMYPNAAVPTSTSSSPQPLPRLQPLHIFLKRLNAIEGPPPPPAPSLYTELRRRQPPLPALFINRGRSSSNQSNVLGIPHYDSSPSSSPLPPERRMMMQSSDPAPQYLSGVFSGHQVLDDEDIYLASRNIRTKGGSWCAKEDKMLLKLVKQYGPKGWPQIATHLPNKTAKQCRDRWHNQLNPAIVTDPWTKDEDQVLLRANKDLGNQWSAIAKLFPGRTPNSVKNRYSCVSKRSKARAREQALFK